VSEEVAQRRNLREVGERIERILDEIRRHADPGTVERAEDLARSLVELYGAGLERILEIVSESEPDGGALVARIADDPFLASLLVLHGLHPVPVDDRIQRALADVRPYLGSHAGGVDYLGVDDEGVVHLRLEGSCNGCPSSTVTVKLAIERAIEEAAPEVTRVDVEGVTAERSPALLQIQGLRNRGNGDGAAEMSAGWTTLGSLGAVPPGSITPLDVDGLPVVVASWEGGLYAYRDACAACDSPLRDATLAEGVLTCPVCEAGFDVRMAGRSANGSERHLDPLPLLPEDGGWKIAIPAARA
jgi:Fe-S cluster biogenesis protein NfuA/nitrite reductase/ring-hydroxylating ferredoxin subunit